MTLPCTCLFGMIENNVFKLKYALNDLNFKKDLDWEFYFNFYSFKFFESISF